MRTLTIAGLILLNVVFNVIANVGFKWSALSARLKEFLTWQVVGNVSGFLAVLTLTFVMRFIPLSQALAFSWGLGFVAIQVVGAHFIFHEVITPLQWVGVALVSGGLIIISVGRSG